MHPSFAAHPSRFQIPPGRRDKETQESHSRLCRLQLGAASVRTWEQAPVKSKQALGLIAEAGLCQEIRKTAAESNEMPSDFSMPSVTRFRGRVRIWLGALGPMGWAGRPNGGAATRDDD